MSSHDAKTANADSFVEDTTENWGLPLIALFDADVQLSKDTDCWPLKLLGALSKFSGLTSFTGGHEKSDQAKERTTVACAKGGGIKVLSAGDIEAAMKRLKDKGKRVSIAAKPIHHEFAQHNDQEEEEDVGARECGHQNGENKFEHDVHHEIDEDE
jgi:hypothetical protein